MINVLTGAAVGRHWFWRTDIGSPQTAAQWHRILPMRNSRFHRTKMLCFHLTYISFNLFLEKSESKLWYHMIVNNMKYRVTIKYRASNIDHQEFSIRHQDLVINLLWKNHNGIWHQLFWNTWMNYIQIPLNHSNRYIKEDNHLVVYRHAGEILSAIHTSFYNRT